jgi:tetratricopeptide (TPR) repeat protein
LLSLAAAPAARAAAPDEEQSSLEQAKALFDKAEAHYQLGHFREALADYEAAFHLRRKAALLFNIAQCHRQLEQFKEAATTYRSFLRLAPENPKSETARELLAKVEEALAKQQAAQTSPPLDTQRPDAAPEIPPSVSAPPVVPPAALAAEAEPAPHLRPRRWTYAAGAGAALAVGAGVVFGLQARATASQLDAGVSTRGENEALRDRFNAQKGRATAALAVGSALAAGAAALFVLRF